jgi:hypothetical protein
MFYEFRQNNTGGNFVIDDTRGIGVWVIVEADSVADAAYRAERVGLYWDGCDTGQDCSCCGDRWYLPRQDDGKEVPSTYGRPIQWALREEPESGYPEMHYNLDGPDGFVHYLDGRVRAFRMDVGFLDEAPIPGEVVQKEIEA